MKANLGSESQSSKANTYVLLANIIQKYKSNEQFQKKINISNFQDCTDEINLDEEEGEEVLILNDDKESEFFKFVTLVIAEDIVNELAIPHEDD